MLKKFSTLPPTVMLSSLLVLSLFGLVALDCFGNPESIYKLLSIQSYTIVSLVLVILAIIRLRFNSFLPKALSYLSLFIFVVGFLVTAVLGVYDWNTFPNASFALTRLNLPQLALLTASAGVIFFLNQSNNWWKKYWKQFTFALPFVLFLFLLVVRLFPFNLFLEIVKEDNIIENSQFFILAIGSIISFWTAVKLRTKNIWYSILLAIWGVGFLMVAGDEISWGQRLFGVETAEILQETNRQGENTFHNLYAIEWLVIYGYTALSTFGLFSRVLIDRIKWFKPLVKFTPSYILTGFFLLPFIYFLTQMLVMWGRWHAWSEVAELYIYMALVFWVVLFGLSEVFYRSKK